MASIIRGKNPRKPYTVRYTVGGKQYERSFVTRREASDYATKVEHDKRAQIFTDPKLGNILFRNYAETWIRQHTGAANSIKAYRGSLDNHVLPALGDTPLRKITRDQVRELLLETMPAKPVGSSIVATARLVITSILGEALRSHRVTENVAAGIRLPRVQEAAEFYVPTRGELEALAATMPDDWQLAIWLMRGCGLRIAEAMAVSKMSVGGGSLRISEQILAKPVRLGPLKHRKPGEFRDVPLPRWVEEKIELHIDRHGTADDGHLFRRQSAEALRQSFMRAATKIKLPDSFTPHDLRHVWASITLARGVPVTDVSRYLGHRSVDLTYRIYSHFIPSSFDTARKVLDEEWGALE
ncbi:MAG: tyrosine-type recombinase/integrase [Pseudonocardiaceae bacterium]